MTGCLTEETLFAFMAGGLSDAELGEVDEHIDACEKCRALLFQAGAEDGESHRSPSSRGRSFPWSRRPTLPEGTLVAQRYRIAKFVGAGGMGEVYEAEDIELRAQIALKSVRAVIAEHPRALTRMKREVLLARRVTHPNVCRIFDFGVHEQVGFLTMELLTGETLGARLRRLGRLSLAEVLPIVEQLAAGLDAAHRAGVVHRDFKGDNVMLVAAAPGEPPRAVVMDFGLARADLSEHASSHPQQSGRAPLVGTVSHMAPEQVEGLEVTPRTDIYALGVVLFELVTGQLPFSGPSPLFSAVKRLTAPPPSPRKLVPELPPHWDAVILRCMAREPSGRYESAGHVVEALKGDPARTSRRAWFPKVALAAFGLAATALLLTFALRSFSASLRPTSSVPEPERAASPSVAAVALPVSPSAPRPTVSVTPSVAPSALASSVPEAKRFSLPPAGPRKAREQRQRTTDHGAGASATSTKPNDDEVIDPYGGPR